MSLAYDSPDDPETEWDVRCKHCSRLFAVTVDDLDGEGDPPDHCTRCVEWLAWCEAHPGATESERGAEYDRRFPIVLLEPEYLDSQKQRAA